MHPGVHHDGGSEGGGGGGGGGDCGGEETAFSADSKYLIQSSRRFTPRAVFPQRCLSRESSPRASDARSFLPRPDRSRRRCIGIGIGIGIGSRRRYLFIASRLVGSRLPYRGSR